MRGGLVVALALNGCGMFNSTGTGGGEPTTAGVPASGGNGINGGGDGGVGFARGQNAASGLKGLSEFSAGGGGAGGSVRVFQVPPRSLGGDISPPPS